MYEHTCTVESSGGIGLHALRRGLRDASDESRCRGCAARSQCPRDMMAEQMAPRELDSLLCPLGLSARQALYRQDEPFASIYLVRSGSLKSEATGHNGRPQILGIHLAGEVVGTDGIAAERRASSMVALETSEVCAMPYAALDRVMRQVPAVQRWFHHALSREMARSCANIALLRSATAEGRVAGFLLDLSRRLSPAGEVAEELRLSVSRGDIAFHLGLTRETVSRVFARFHRQRILGGGLNQVRLWDPEQLCSLAACATERAPAPGAGACGSRARSRPALACAR